MERCLNCMELCQEQYEICPHCGYVKGTAPKEIYHLYPGTVLNDRYIIGTVVGAGGFGVVYRAWDSTLEKMVAVKEYYPTTLVSRVPGEKQVYIYAKKRESEYYIGMERFLEEARNMARFSSHPHIVNVYNYFEENNTAYCVMEFMKGISFKTYIKQQGGIVKEETAIQVTLLVLDALKDIHKAGIIHRDIAPDNVMMITRENEKAGTEFINVKLMDFGAARFSKGDTETNLTVVLKPGFAPAEQYKSRSKQGPFTDLYAVGAMLYRAVTGVMPEESTNRIKEECLAQPKDLNPQITEKTNNIILRAMAMQSELRFQSTDEFRQALLEQKSVKNAEEELNRRKKKRKIGAILISFILVIGAVVGIFFYQNKKAQTILKPAELTMWVQAEAGEEAAVESTFQSLTDEFCKSYPQIEIDVVAISKEEYADELEKASQNNEMPDIYESTGFEISQLKAAEELDGLYKQIELNEYYGLAKFEQNADILVRLPISFSRPVLYVNSTTTNAENFVLEDVEAESSLDDFVQEKTNYLLADTTSYFTIQNALPARYVMKQVPDGVSDRCNFVTYLSMSDEVNTSEKNAVYQFFKYLLSDSAQYNLTIKQHTGNSISYGLPINKEQYDIFVEINAEFEVFDETEPRF